MGESFKMVLVLMIIAMISGAVLSQVYNFTYGPIQDNLARKLHGSIFEVLPEAEDVTVIESRGAAFIEDDSSTLRNVDDSDNQPLLLYQGLDAAGNPVGFAYVSEETGFAGIIKVMVGVDHDEGVIQGITILEHVETAGIGTRIEEEDFRDQFRGKNVSDPISIGEDIDVISGATISSQAVTKAVRKDFEYAVMAYREAI